MAAYSTAQGTHLVVKARAAARPTAADGKGQRHAGDEDEQRKDQVVEGETGPVRVLDLAGEQPDGRGVALRFAVGQEAQGHGLAREAAGAALRFGHDVAGLKRIVAVARESNVGSRVVLGAIGMTACESFEQNGYSMAMYESTRR